MRHPSTHPRVRLVVAALLLTACAKEPQTLTKPDFAVRYAAAANLSAWSEATSTSFTEINTASAIEGCPFIAKSGNVLYFASNRAGGYGGLDLYVSHWDAAAQAWGEPTNMGPGINTASNEQCPLVLNSGKELVFASDRSGGAGGLDLWLADRRDHRDDLGWQSPVNLTALNTGADEFGPGAYEEDGTTVLYFNSNRSGGAGKHDLYVSTRSPGGTFLPPVPAAGLNTPAEEQYASLSKDGREIFFSSDRPGGQGGFDLWHATRESTSDLWDTPVNLGPAVNSTFKEGRSAIAWDGMTLIFNSSRTGIMDLYQTTRTRLPGRRN